MEIVSMENVQLIVRGVNDNPDRYGEVKVVFYVEMSVLPFSNWGDRTDAKEYLHTLDKESERYKFLSLFIEKGNKLHTRLEKSVQEEKELWETLISYSWNRDKPNLSYSRCSGYCPIEDCIDDGCDKRLEGFFNDAFDYLYRKAKDIKKPLTD